MERIHTSGSLEPERRDWDELATVDAYWAVLTHGDRGGGPDDEAFLASGSRIAKRVLADSERFGLPVRFEKALDFGCGPGRVTRALAARFEKSVGVDVSPLMIAEAERLNADSPRCRFEAVEDPSLPDLPDGAFDLVHTRHVLEHVPRAAILDLYLPALVRVLAPGGLLVVGLPSSLRRRHRLGLRRRAYLALRTLRLPPAFLQTRLHLSPIRMTAVSRRDVEAALSDAGARVLEVRSSVGATGAVKTTYLATRDPSGPA
jgi:SAM-dependent methyltransferase